MNIVLVRDVVLPVKKYGGTERVVWALGRELVRMGHQVTLLLHRGSSCPFARLLEIDPSRSIGSQIPEDTDIVHFQDTAETADLQKPYVVTINGNKDADDIRLQVEGVEFPAGVEVHDAVACDGAVQYGPVGRMFRADFGGEQMRITEAHAHEWPTRADEFESVSAARVSNRVALEKQCLHKRLAVRG